MIPSYSSSSSKYPRVGSGEGRQPSPAIAGRIHKRRRRLSFAVFPAVLMVLMGWAVPLHAEIREHPRFIDVVNDKGGNVLEMVKLRENLARSGKTVRIRGYCRSACTMLTTMPNACLGPNARIGFHAPRIPNTSIIPPYVDQIMGSFYRGGIRDRWFGGWNRSLNMNVISARQYVQLDPQARICKSIKTGKK